MLDRLLEDLRARVPDGRAALLVAADGMIVAGSGARDDDSWDLVGAATADLVRRSARAHREAGLDAPEELSWTSGSGTILYRALGTEVGLLVAIGPDASVGRTRWEMRRAGPALRSRL